MTSEWQYEDESGVAPCGFPVRIAAAIAILAAVAFADATPGMTHNVEFKKPSACGAVAVAVARAQREVLNRPPSQSTTAWS